MSVDTRLLGYWKQQQRTRLGARKNLPASWRNDPRPEMHAVTEAYVELLARIKQPSPLHVIGSDDR